MDRLPYLGLGLTANLDGRAPPDPWALHAARPELVDFVEYSAPVTYDPSLWQGRSGLPLLFHPVHLNLWGPELEPPEVLAALDAQARQVGSPWVGNDVGWWHTRGEPSPATSMWRLHWMRAGCRTRWPTPSTCRRTCRFPWRWRIRR